MSRRRGLEHLEVGGKKLVEEGRVHSVLFCLKSGDLICRGSEVVIEDLFSDPNFSDILPRLKTLISKHERLSPIFNYKTTEPMEDDVEREEIIGEFPPIPVKYKSKKWTVRNVKKSLTVLLDHLGFGRNKVKNYKNPLFRPIWWDSQRIGLEWNGFSGPSYTSVSRCTVIVGLIFDFYNIIPETAHIEQENIYPRPIEGDVVQNDVVQNDGDNGRAHEWEEDENDKENAGEEDENYKENEVEEESENGKGNEGEEAGENEKENEEEHDGENEVIEKENGLQKQNDEVANVAKEGDGSSGSSCTRKSTRRKVQEKASSNIVKERVKKLKGAPKGTSDESLKRGTCKRYL